MFITRIASPFSTFFKSAASSVLPFICMLIIIYTLVPLATLFRPSDDYMIYEYFAETVSNNLNPYSMQSDYYSEKVTNILTFNSSQRHPGVIRQEYADYPPLLMMINSLAYRIHDERGIYSLYVFLYALSLVFYLVYLKYWNSDSFASNFNPLIFLIFFGLNPVFFKGWFNPITDKIWFPFFILLLFLSRNKPYWIAIILALFTAIKGIGIFIMVFYLIYLYANKILNPKKLALLILVFGLVLILSHLFWFPDWINGYKWRADRQNFINQFSLFFFLDKTGFLLRMIPLVITILTFILIILLTIKRNITINEILTLPIVISIIFNTELTYDRLLVAVFILTLLAKQNIIVLVSYLIGISVVYYFGFNSWIAMWGWTFFLLAAVSRQIINRKNSVRPVLEQ